MYTESELRLLKYFIKSFIEDNFQALQLFFAMSVVNGWLINLIRVGVNDPKNSFLIVSVSILILMTILIIPVIIDAYLRYGTEFGKRGKIPAAKCLFLWVFVIGIVWIYFGLFMLFLTIVPNAIPAFFDMVSITSVFVIPFYIDSSINKSKHKLLYSILSLGIIYYIGNFLWSNQHAIIKFIVTNFWYEGINTLLYSLDPQITFICNYMFPLMLIVLLITFAFRYLPKFYDILKESIKTNGGKIE